MSRGAEGWRGGASGVGNLGVGVGDRRRGDPPAPRMVCLFPVRHGLGVEKTEMVSRLLPNGEQRDGALGDPQREGTVPALGFEREEGSSGLRVGETASCCPRPVGAEVPRRPGFLTRAPSAQEVLKAEQRRVLNPPQ